MTIWATSAVWHQKVCFPTVTVLKANLKLVGILKTMADLLTSHLPSTARCLMNQEPFEVSNWKCFWYSVEQPQTQKMQLCHHLTHKVFVNNWTAGCESCRQVPSSSVHPQGHDQSGTSALVEQQMVVNWWQIITHWKRKILPEKCWGTSLPDVLKFYKCDKRKMHLECILAGGSLEEIAHSRLTWYIRRHRGLFEL